MKKKQRCSKKARISKSLFKKAELATLPVCWSRHWAVENTTNTA